MTNPAVRIHKMLGILAVLLTAVVGLQLQLHTQPHPAAGFVTAVAGPQADSGWGP
ncbi:hypothetical protein ACIQOW_17080 [Kitasatospora sp. NPDC091335]|uniref:hypothetical protein n=1 Tax=Streptomycetaceae TaxID=2062 RepID=UPI001661DFB7|nr:hypothetical protein [Streptomyces sp. CBMA156]